MSMRVASFVLVACLALPLGACGQAPLAPDDIVLGVKPMMPLSEVKVAHFQRGLPDVYSGQARPDLPTAMIMETWYDRGLLEPKFKSDQLTSLSFRALNGEICSIEATFRPHNLDNATELQDAAVRRYLQDLTDTVEGRELQPSERNRLETPASWKKEREALENMLVEHFGRPDKKSLWLNRKPGYHSVELKTDMTASSVVVSEAGMVDLIANRLEYVFNPRCDLTERFRQAAQAFRRFQKLGLAEQAAIVSAGSAKLKQISASITARPQSD